MKGKNKSGANGTGLLAAIAVGLAYALCFSGPVKAQPQNPQGTNPLQTVPAEILRIRSEPTGAVVTLVGDHTWKGITPWNLNRGLTGSYEVLANLKGYEQWKRTIHLAGGEIRDLDIVLRPKKASRAALRSLLVPGWGHFYSDRPMKGRLVLLGTAVALGGLWWTHSEYRDRIDDLDRAKDAYRAVDVDGEFDEPRSAMKRAQGRAETAYDNRQIFMYAAGGLYALAFIDSYFFFPKQPNGSFASISPWGENGPEFAIEPGTEETIRLAVRLNGLDGGER